MRLKEVLPELAGSELGELPVASAPPVGATLTLRRSEVLRALGSAGVSADGLAIPPSVHISRKVVRVSADELKDAAEAALREVADPCTVLQARLPKEVSVSDGPRSVRAELTPALRSGQVSATLVIDGGGRESRVAISASLKCPEPDITPGKQITLVAIVGHVTASAPGEARQGGRVGEIIRVTNRATNASLRARVIDAQTAEVVQ